ncbi:MAG: GNAT family N-acetyltransferase [Rubrobacter sp.]
MADKRRDQALSGIQRDLGGGLILRQARGEDAEAVAVFNARIHHSSGDFDQRELHRGIAAGTRDLMSGDHPTCDASDFTVVEDTRTGSIVSSTCLIPQKFSYEGLEFDAGLPELVGTHPDYRRRGLVKEQFEVLHRWSEERGNLMQAIGGIPYYYRRFGYEMAVYMGEGSRIYIQDVPGKPSSPDEGDGSPRSYTLRPAAASDARFLSELHGRGRGCYLLTSSRDEGLWRYEVAGRNPESDESLEVRIVEDAKGKPTGYVCHTRDLRNGALEVYGYELANGVSWLEVTPFVLRELAETGHKHASGEEKLASLTFVLGEQHPLHEVIPEPPLYRLDHHGHYSFYVRVPDLPGFLRHVAPVLEQRLAASVAAGHTGKLEVSFYGDGLRLELKRGRLSGVESWSPTVEERGDAAFPDLTFLQLLFGYRSLEELDRAFADCSPGEGDARVLLRALFPRRPSDLWPVC